MKLLSKNNFFEDNCPYIKDEKFKQEYFFATDFTEDDYQKLLEFGWRHFGNYFFKPVCENCKKCQPIRIDVQNFTPSKSQRKILKKNEKIEVIISSLNPTLEIYELYKKHSKVKFNQETNIDNFIYSFYYKSEITLQSEYYYNNKLVGIGFIDRVKNGLSSIYFAYDTDYSHLSLGTYSAIYEINYAKSLNFKYYYLGYYIKESSRMSYKNRFKPYQLYDWNSKSWNLIKKL